MRRGNLEDIEGHSKDCGKKDPVSRGNLEERDAGRTTGEENQ